MSTSVTRDCRQYTCHESIPHSGAATCSTHLRSRSKPFHQPHGAGGGYPLVLPSNRLIASHERLTYQEQLPRLRLRVKRALFPHNTQHIAIRLKLKTLNTEYSRIVDPSTMHRQNTWFVGTGASAHRLMVTRSCGVRSWYSTRHAVAVETRTQHRPHGDGRDNPLVSPSNRSSPLRKRPTYQEQFPHLRLRVKRALFPHTTQHIAIRLKLKTLNTEYSRIVDPSTMHRQNTWFVGTGASAHRLMVTRSCGVRSWYSTRHAVAVETRTQHRPHGARRGYPLVPPSNRLIASHARPTC